MFWDGSDGTFIFFVLSYAIYFNKVTVILFVVILLEDIIRMHGMELLCTVINIPIIVQTFSFIILN
jgi:hypothetical protein